MWMNTSAQFVVKSYLIVLIVEWLYLLNSPVTAAGCCQLILRLVVWHTG